MQKHSILVVKGVVAYEDPIMFIVSPLCVWWTTAGEYREPNVLRNIRGVVLGEDRVCRGNPNCFEVWFVEHLLVTEAVNPDTLDLPVSELLSFLWWFIMI